MPVSVVLETALGLVFLFALLSLLCSGIVEAVSSMLQKRATYLLKGLRLLLDQPATGKTTAMLEPDKPPVAAPVDLPGTKQLVAQVTTPTAYASAAQAVNNLAVESAAGNGADMRTTAQQVINTGGLTVALFGHPLIHGLHTPRVRLDGLFRLLGRIPLIGRYLRRSPVQLPAYISAESFARTLIDTLTPDASDELPAFETLEKTVRDLPDAIPAKKSLLALLKRSERDIVKFERLLAQWYDEHMLRVSGWYKRWTRVVLAVVGLIIAVIANVDTVQVARSLYFDQPLRDAVVAQATAGSLCENVPPGAERARCANRELTTLTGTGLPVWWPAGCGAQDLSRCFRYAPTGPTEWQDYGIKLAGWLITAFAISFGAPFWFESLSRLGSLRSTGPRPK